MGAGGTIIGVKNIPTRIAGQNRYIDLTNILKLPCNCPEARDSDGFSRIELIVQRFWSRFLIMHLQKKDDK